MTASWLYMAGTLIGLWFTVQAIRPVALPKRPSIPSFFAGWLTNELALHHIFWQAVVSAVFIAYGALGHWAGWVAVGLTMLQWTLNLYLVKVAIEAGDVMEEVLRGTLGGDYRDDLPGSPRGWDRPDWKRLIIPFRIKHPWVERERNIVYERVAATNLKLDIFRTREARWPGEPLEKRPVLIYVHGGAWFLGFRDRQGGPLLTEMAARGWIGILPSYRLSPTATAPEHVEDVKRAIAWVRRHADELGADPDFIALAGNSAGGHLAALAAMTGTDTTYQPGFEDADCRVQACVPLYGVYDVADERGRRQPEMTDYMARFVIKADLDEEPERWHRFSPLAQLHTDAPPFLIVHGAKDSLTSPKESEEFASNLADISAAPVGLAMLPGAQHAFDTFPSIRTAFTVRGVARFLATVHARWQHGRAVAPATSGATIARGDDDHD